MYICNVESETATERKRHSDFDILNNVHDTEK